MAEMPQRRFDILALGEPMVELNQHRHDDARQYLRGFGGDTSNAAIAAARQGAKVRTGPLLAQCAALKDEAFDAVFHLASAVSGECELDFELGLRSNLDSTRALLDALRARVQAGLGVAKLVFSSSVAVFGPDAAVPMPARVADDTLPAPQTSYGTQKFICEHLIADYTRKGFVDGRAARLMTVTVRPGRPNGAASSFFSGIIREPLAGEEAVLPVDLSVSHPLTSPRATVQGLIKVCEASREAFNGRLGLNLPALNITVGEMLEALERVAGPGVRARVKQVRDERIAGIVANWPRGATFARATALGLTPENSFDDIIRQPPRPPQRLEGHAMNHIDLAGRVAVVTGGAQGIGYAISERFLRSGAEVVIWDIDAARAQAAVAALSALGQVSLRAVELTDDEAVRAATAALPRIDILVNNAGITGGNGPTWELDPAVWRRTIE
ncbi:hypothetical protein B566_EDAN019109, partial [Ephemera danica]